MNCIALVSGGKDSIHSIVCGSLFGYDVKYVAHLIPREQKRLFFF